jgi:hypothetical protein
MPERIYHVSEMPGIARFDPRPDTNGRDFVWAIGESRLHNYLLPRDCPRVTYYAAATTTAADRRAFLSVSDEGSVVAIEQAWLPAVQSARLYVYEFASDAFELEDSIAAYYVSPGAATPIACGVIADPLLALFERNVELRVLSLLWPLHDAVAASSLGFSIIRMRNAKPRPSTV